tara:strand:- start:4162 stop:4566 length:405 start_codon:yes stop_codon:yes gene_type:complete
MKLNKLHLFIILIGILALSSLGLTIHEGLENMKNSQLEREEKYQQQLDDRFGEDENNSFDEDKNNSYILKSEVVPPVCPKCPQRTACPRPKPCPACPPCARCPEPAFECKKVPNYSSVDNSRLPLPMLNSFSQF